MINSIEYTHAIYNAQKTKPLFKQKNTVKQSQAIKADKYVSQNPKQNVKKAIKDGSLVYTEPTKLFGLVTLRAGFYTYSPQKGETIGDIKQKFGIKDKVISSLNSVYDDEYCPANDKRNIIFTLDE